MSRTDHLPEFDILHSQVADLSRRLAERDRSMQDLREHSAMLRAIIEGIATETGDEFFAALVRHLTAVLHIQYAVIGEVQGDHIKKIRTLAVSAGGVLVDNFDYELADTPCAAALTQTFVCFNRDVQATFPQFQRLVDLGAESYCAVPIRTKGGAAIGLLVVMDTKPLEHSDALQSLLGVFAPRVAAEFERKRAEQERAQALADLHNVIETIPDIVFALDTQGNVVKWNQRLGDVTGYSPEELLNMPALAFVPPEERVRTATAIERAFTEGYAELEGHLLTKEHRLIPYHWTGALLKNLRGESIGITGIGRDVSGKKQAEAELRASEERYRALYEETPTMYFTLATDGTVLSVNRFGAEQLGYRVEELIGHSVLDLFHARDKEAVVSSLSECLANPEEMRHWAFRKVRKDGSIVWVREAVRVGQSSSGESVLLVTCEDITERRQVERIVQHRLEFERLIASLSTYFVNIPSNDIDAGINQALCSTGQFAEADRSYVFLFRNNGKTVDNTHEWCAGGIVPQIDNLQGLHTDSFPWIMARHRRGEVTSLHRVADLPPEASAEKEEFEREGIQSLLTVPIVSSRGVIGFVGFDLVRNERAWADDDIALLKIVGEMLASVIERKRAEEALRDSQEHLRQALQASNIGLWDWNTETMEVVLSREWKGQLGYEESDLANVFESWTTHLHPDDRDRAMAFVQAYLANPVGDYHQEFRLQHKDGTYRWIEARASIVTESDGRRVRLVGSHTDITERKQSEATLRLAKFSVDRAADAVYWIGPQATILDVNEAASRMLGYSRDELCAMTVHDLNPDFQADSWPGFWAETQRCGTMVVETVHRAKNGRLIPIEVSVNYLSYEGKEYHCAFARDITERKRAEQAQAQLIEDLTRSRQHFQTLFNWTPSAVGISTVAEGRFIDVNEAFNRLTGYAREEAIGRTTLELGLWADPSERESALRKIQEQGYLHNWEGRLRTKSGEIRSLIVSVHSITLGLTPCLILLGHDITERKRMEDTLHQRERDLRAAIEERERISQDLHDGILQSLFAVGLALEVSKSKMSPRALKTSGASLDRAIDQLNRVMREIRNFIAGLDSDLLEGKDLSTALQSMLKSLTENQTTRVRLAVENRAAKAISVEQSLHLLHVIQEAVSNCIRHGRAQEAMVSLKMLKQSIRLSIRDNGRGFNEGTVKGIGHGLANMEARAMKIGGRFALLSKENEGTRIILDLPKEVPGASR
jgi:PAS domain S-box-containing protein